MTTVSLRNIVKRYGKIETVHGINLEIKENEFIVLVGPSGCGKSTTLRMVAGLEEISDGQIFIGDRLVNDEAPKDRNIAMVFQNYALYPHMNVFENMAFGLKLKKTPAAEIKERVNHAASILGLTSYLERKPAALSGGQRQRVAMGRAIVRNPKVFLFDEPLSNLDAQLRTQMRMEIKKLHLRSKTTTIYVTHDQVEAMTLADRIVIMKNGYIEQIGTPFEVFERPVNLFVARFIGNPPMNICKGVVKKEGDDNFVDLGKFRLFIPSKTGVSLTPGMEVMLGIRPEDIALTQQEENTPQQWKFSATVEVAETLGSTSILEINLNGISFVAAVEGRVLPKQQEVISVTFNLNQVHLFDAKSEKSIY